MGSTLFRDPQARSTALAALGSLQHRAVGSLNRVDALHSASNLYLEGLIFFRTIKQLVGFKKNLLKKKKNCFEKLEG